MAWFLGAICLCSICLVGGYPTGSFAEPDAASAVQESVRVAEAGVALHPKDARAQVRLGHAYLKAGRGEDAMAAFRRAADLDGKLAEAFNGIGLVYLEAQGEWQMAEKYFMQALRRNRGYVEAQFNIARAHMSVGNHSARREAERAIRIDSTYAPAYRLIAEWYEDRDQPDRAIEYYGKFLELRPEDQSGGYKASMSLLDRGRYDEAEKFAIRYLNGGPRYAILAQVLLHRRDYAKAVQAFELYLSDLSSNERALYEDISLVATPEQAAEYRKIPESRRASYLREFWLRHDPALVSGGIERRAEHYRRVWHARTYFGKRKFPWDRRGEVYVRYGVPDYRSTSRQINFEVPPRVRQIQEQLALEIYGPAAAGATFVGPVFPIRTGKVAEADYVEPTVQPDYVEFEISSVPAGSVLEDTLGLARYRPVTSGFYSVAVPWESWVYTDVQGGLEVVFTDEMGSGVFEYAPMPMPTAEDYSRIRADGALSAMIRKFNRYTPELVMNRATSVQPERYNVSTGVFPIDFSYDLADFQGMEGETRVEVYAAIPVGQLGISGVEDTVVTIERTVALSDSAFQKVYRTRNEMRVRGGAGQVGLALDQTQLQVPPGRYVLGVRVWQKDSDKMQVFRQEVDVEAYSGEGLLLSDIQVARQVTTDPESGSRYQKGEFVVSPAPARTFYVDQSIFLYFEVYGLEKDPYGATRYEVSHSLREKQGRPLLVRALSRLGGLLGTGEGEQEVTVRYEQAGAASHTGDFVELDLGRASAGEYRVRVTIRDLIGEREVTKEAFFKLVERK